MDDEKDRRGEENADDIIETGGEPTDSGATENIHSNHRNRMRSAAVLDPELNGFRDVELLELFASFFVPQRDTNPTAHALIDEFGSVVDVLRAPAEKLINVKGVPKSMARTLPALVATISQRIGAPVMISDHFAAADYFGSEYLSGDNDGTFVVCLDGGGRVLGLERCTGKDEVFSFRAVFGAVGRYNAKKALLVRREKGFFPDLYSLNMPLKKLAFLLSEVGVRLIDFLLFTDSGYYTLGQVPTAKSGWSPQFTFVPTKQFASSPELLEKFAESMQSAEAAATDDLPN
ncbi:MAG: hypothetical protein HDT28_00870 [Clostridiales bacterium]|nr:hypothetical protein [Clostridiales bacterium]